MIFFKKKLILLSIFCALLVLFIYFISKSKIFIENFDLLSGSFINKKNLTEIDKNFKFDNLIAHAGGGINGLTYTNSLEALEENYKKGFRFFEIDLDISSDDVIILYHCSECYKKPSLKEFKLLLSKQNLTGMTLNDLRIWMFNKKDAYIIINVKTPNKNIEILSLIKNSFVDINRLIPQVYDFREYFHVRKLGFNKIIITLYLKNYSDKTILRFITNNRVSALTMPISRFKKDFIKKINDLNVPVFLHTINDLDVANDLSLMGVYGFYTDFLQIDNN